MRSRSRLADRILSRYATPFGRCPVRFEIVFTITFGFGRELLVSHWQHVHRDTHLDLGDFNESAPFLQTLRILQAIQLVSIEEFSRSGEFRNPTFPGVQRFVVFSPSYRQVKQRFPAVGNLVVPLFTLQDANPLLDLGPALLKAEDLTVLSVVVADITFSDYLISRQSLIARVSFGL